MASDRAVRQMVMLKSLGLTETLTYRPAAGDARSIEATVDRGGPEALLQALAPGMMIAVLNDASLGIDAATMDVGSDSIDVAERIGGTAESRGIQRVIDQDADFLRLAVI